MYVLHVLQRGHPVLFLSLLYRAHTAFAAQVPLRLIKWHLPLRFDSSTCIESIMKSFLKIGRVMCSLIRDKYSFFPWKNGSSVKTDKQSAFDASYAFAVCKGSK